jgi:protein-S-isoprenylcysteine O-methyltransferase Ste14
MPVFLLMVITHPTLNLWQRAIRHLQTSNVNKNNGNIEMDPKVIVIIALSYVYCLFEICMNLRRKTKAKGASLGDKGSLFWLYGLITLGYSLSFSIAMTKIGRIPSWNTWFVIGMIFFTLGLGIRVTSILTLNRFFTYSVSKLEGQKMTTHGIYRILRHPGYLGQLIIFMGIALSLSNWLSTLAMMIPVSLGFFNRIKVEEKFMVEQFGEEYLDYMKRTKRIIPLVF